MPDSPADPGVFAERTEASSYCCPDCGSFLDAPRVNPSDGELGRKCASCREWHPVGARQLRNWQLSS
jgi:hypothetical protein